VFGGTEGGCTTDMRRITVALALALALAVVPGCAPAARGSTAQQALLEIGPKPGEPVRSMLASRGPTDFDSRLQAALDRHGAITADVRTAGLGAQETSGPPSASKTFRQDGTAFEEVAYGFGDKSELVVQSIVNSSGLRVLVSMTAQ